MRVLEKLIVLHISLIPPVIPLKLSLEPSRFLKSQRGGGGWGGPEIVNLTHTDCSFTRISLVQTFTSLAIKWLPSKVQHAFWTLRYQGVAWMIISRRNKSNRKINSPPYKPNSPGNTSQAIFRALPVSEIPGGGGVQK